MRRRRFFTFIAIFILVVGFLTIGIKESGLLAIGENVYTKWQIAYEVFTHITEDYVDEKDNIDLIDKAIQGMVDDLDPHSVYIGPSQSQQMDDRFKGYEGIGISFRVINDKITIMEVNRDGPSAKVGLRRGDRIIAIDGESAIGISQEDVPRKLKGPRGTSVKVTVEREGWKNPKDFTITRDKVTWRSVDFVFKLTDDIGYLKITSFTATTGDELEEALINLEEQKIKKLIVDLRDNTGGYLEAAVKVCDLFLPAGKKIVFTKGRPENKRAFREWFARDGRTRPFIPLIVMINEYSASASEIVSGAVQDWDRGLVVGKTSFGKGLVQTPYQFNDGSRLLLTTARYYTPSGRLIQRPYSGRSKEEYYREARDDSLHQLAIKRAEETDSLMFTTAMGRRVFGGGGITPDIIVENPSNHFSDIFPEGVSPTLFMDFAEYYGSKHPEIKNDFNAFFNQTDIGELIIRLFKDFIVDKDVKFNEEAFDTNMDEIGEYIRLELASQLWDDDARKKVELQMDNQLKTAIENFSEAEHLLKSFMAQQ